MSGASTRLARLLALVPWLVANNGVSLHTAAEHFGISTEQLEQDLWLLVVSGLPGYGHEHLVDIQFWDDGLVHVLDPQTIDRPLRLSVHEAFALQLGLRLLAQVSDDPAIASAMAKLEDASGSSVPPSVAALERSEVTEVINAALDAHRVLRIRYANSATDAAAERDIEPTRLTAAADHAYVDAWCRSAEAWRTFRLDRILSASVLSETFEPRAFPEAVPAERVQVRLALQPSARWVAESHGTIVTETDDSIETVIEAADARWVVRLVLSLGGAGKVLAPSSIAKAVAEEAALALRAYS